MLQTADLLDPTALPRFSAMTARAVEAALDRALTRYEDVVADLVRRGSVQFEELWLPLERVETVLDVFWASVSHLNAMTADPALRRVYAEGEARLVAATTRVRQDGDLYRLLVALEDSPAFTDRPGADQAAVVAMIGDFELSGVGLPPGLRARYAAMAEELTALASGFAGAVQEATEAWSEQVTDPAVLVGLPETSLAAFAAAARERGLQGWLVTLKDSDMGAVLAHAQDRDLRRRLYEAFGTRASDQGPHAGLYDNSERIARILALRREAALLLGFATPADWSLASKMAPGKAEVTAFLRNLAAKARPAAEAELAEVRA
ncbi:MAG: M3 family metallopeptidase, partial [Brevundimonas sp.]